MITHFRLDDGQIEVVDDAVAEILRQKTPAERVALVFEAWRLARSRVTEEVASQHTDWDAATVRDEVNRIFLNEDVCDWLKGRDGQMTDGQAGARG